jgi:hypothetical protein
LPRPSAIASAKLPNITVNQSQKLIAKINEAGSSERPNNAWMPRAVVRTLPARTTNMTGLRAWRRGSSFRNESMIAP